MHLYRTRRSSTDNSTGASFISASKKAFSSLRFIYKSLAIYIFIENDLYIKRKPFIYKLKIIYIQIVIRLLGK